MSVLGNRLGAIALLAPAMLIALFAFLVPLARLVGLSFSAKAGPFVAYAQLLGDDVYARVFANTFVIAVVVTVAALVIAFPIAFALTRLPRAWRALVFACVLLPLWISVLVRTFSWMLLLERNGPINRFIVAAGLRDQPLSILFNHTAVLIGMVHVLLPYAVLPIYAALVRIDPALLRASEGLGASPATTFRRVLFPLSLTGVATGSSCCSDVSVIRMMESIGCKRQHRGDAGAFDRVLELALMQRASAGDAARKDLPALRDELLQHLHVFVIDVLELLDAELADALAAVEKLLLAARSARSAGSATAAFRPSSTTTRCHGSHVVGSPSFG